MPLVHIDIIKRGARERRALASAVTDAIVSSLKVAPEAVHIVINEMSPSHYAVAGQLKADSKPKKPAKSRKK